LEHGNLFVAEATAREVGHIHLHKARADGANRTARPQAIDEAAMVRRITRGAWYG